MVVVIVMMLIKIYNNADDNVMVVMMIIFRPHFSNTASLKDLSYNIFRRFKLNFKTSPRPFH